MPRLLGVDTVIGVGVGAWGGLGMKGEGVFGPLCGLWSLPVFCQPMFRSAESVLLASWEHYLEGFLYDDQHHRLPTTFKGVEQSQ